MNRIFLVLVTLSLASCMTLKSKYFTYYNDSLFEQDRKQGYVDSIVLDKSYSLFVREICRKKPIAGFYTSRNPGYSAAVEKCDCQDPSIGYPKERQEIQYLFVSKERGQVVFITTFPPAILDGKMTYDMPMFDNDSFVNINYFNTFLFGTLKNGVISFSIRDPERVRVDSRDADFRWYIKESVTDGYLEVSKITLVEKKRAKVLLPSDILKPEIRFHKKERYTLGLSNKIEYKIISTHNTVCLNDRKIFLTTSDKNGKGSVENISFRFNKDIDSSRTGSRTIFFSPFRIHAAPVLSGSR